MQKTMQFRKKLKTNNNRDWCEAHKEEYLQARSEYELFLDKVIKGVLKFDRQVSPDTDAKSCMFRIYKDVRFSKDKTPYKTNMGASINPGGRKSVTAGYYVHIEPGNSFIAGGLWMPEPPMLAAIRQEIDYNPKPLLKILNAAGFKKFYKGLDEDGQL